VRRDVGDLLNAIDVFVLPSLWEGLPLALILAMGAGGTGLLRAMSPACLKLFEDGRTGLLVPPADREALGRALAHLVTDPAAGRRLGDSARRAVLPRFGVDGWNRFHDGALRSAAGGDSVCESGARAERRERIGCGSGAAQALKPGKPGLKP